MNFAQKYSEVVRVCEQNTKIPEIPGIFVC